MKESDLALLKADLDEEKIELLSEISNIKEILREEKDERYDLDGDNNNIDMLLEELERAEKKLKAIKESLSKMESGDYGICEVCGEKISLERLRFLPYTKICMKCTK